MKIIVIVIVIVGRVTGNVNLFAKMFKFIIWNARGEVEEDGSRPPDYNVKNKNTKTTIQLNEKCHNDTVRKYHYEIGSHPTFHHLKKLHRFCKYETITLDKTGKKGIRNPYR